MEEKNIKIWNTIINYKQYFNQDNKYCLLILHWWWWSSNSWTNFWEKLFFHWFNLIIPDLPWFWKTKIDKIYTLENYAELIEKFVLELKLQNIILWWHSNGWAISIKIENRKKIKIEQLILNNSAWIRNNKKRTIKRKLLNSFVKIIKKLSHIIPLPMGEARWEQSKIRILFYKLIWNNDYINSEKNPFLKQTYLNMISSDLTEEISNITLDTLLIWWEKDTYTPLNDWMKMRKLIKNSKFVMLEKQKHWIHLHNPELLLNTFLNNI